jgi:hypothetical protein
VTAGHVNQARFARLVLPHLGDAYANRLGNPYDNAKAETLMKTLKQQTASQGVKRLPAWAL